ncbi:MAG: GDP-mannose 4,6-dehydratase [Proteobacteria bacterium]|nr:GDP-mannose 4,6-dehydratase [Pseudomonadota bacterium]
MRALITGGAGFIGSHLAEHLLELGHSVTVLDDLSTGSRDNVRHLQDRENFGLVVDTVLDESVVAALVDQADVIYHLAAAVGVQLIVKSPVHTIETNVHGTEVVLHCATKNKKPVLVASTSEVYGKSKDLPFREDSDLVMGPSTKGRWSYACSKALDEFLALAYWKEKHVPTVVVRLFNTVGPRQTGQYGMVIPRFVRQALAKKPITVYGDGRQTRCFLNVTDVVTALPALMANPAAAGQVYNLGSQHEISILALAERIKELAGSDSEIIFIPYDEAYEEGFEDMPRRVPSTEKAAALIGFAQKKSLDQTLGEVIAFYRQ